MTPMKQRSTPLCILFFGLACAAKTSGECELRQVVARWALVGARATGGPARDVPAPGAEATEQGTEAAEAIVAEAPAAAAAQQPSAGTADGAADDDSKTPLIDHAVLDQFAQDVGDEILPDLINDFIEDTLSRLKKLQTPPDATNREELEREAHSLKGSAGTVGGQRLFEAAQVAEDLFENNDLDAAQAAVAQLTPIAEATVAAYVKILAARAA